MNKVILLFLTIFCAFPPMYAMEQLSYAQACECLGIKQDATTERVISAFIKKRNSFKPGVDEELMQNLKQAKKFLDRIISKRALARLNNEYDKNVIEIVRRGPFLFKEIIEEYNSSGCFNTIEVDRYDYPLIIGAATLGVISLIIASYFYLGQFFNKG